MNKPFRAKEHGLKDLSQARLSWLLHKLYVREGTIAIPIGRGFITSHDVANSINAIDRAIEREAAAQAELEKGQ